MSRRRRREASPTLPQAEAPSLRGRLMLALVAVAVVVAFALGAYWWPVGETPEQPPLDAVATIELPKEPESFDTDQLRNESVLAVGQLTERYPESPLAHRTAASLHQLLKQYDSAVIHWQKCIALEPAKSDAQVSLAKVQLLQGDDARALQTLTAALAGGLQSADVFEQLSLAHERSGELEQAEQFARQGAEKFPKNAGLWIVLARVQFQRDQLADAKTSIDTALQIEPNSHAARFSAANIYARLGARAEADEHRRQMEKLKAAATGDRLPFEEDYNRSLGGFVAAIYTAIALEYDSHGQSAEAEHWCRRAIALRPGSLEPYGLLVNIYRRREEVENAFVVQKRLMELEPASVANRVNFASLALQLGRLNDGESALLAAARIAPQNALVRRSLAALYMQQRQLTQARAVAQEAVDLEPTHDGYKLLAAVCREQGDLNAAQSAEQAAQALESRATP